MSHRVRSTGDLATWCISRLEAWEMQSTSVCKGDTCLPAPPSVYMLTNVLPAAPEDRREQEHPAEPPVPRGPPQLAAALAFPSLDGPSTLLPV